MNTALWYPQGYDPRYAQGWTLSIVLHLITIGLAVALLSDLHLASQPDTFRWQVSVVATTGPSGAQETAATPMEPPPVPPTPAALSASKPAPLQKAHPVPRQPVTPRVPAAEPPSRNALERSQQSIVEETHSVPLDGPSPNVTPHVTPPVQPLRSDPSQTATLAPSMSPPPFNESAASSDEPPPPDAFSAPAEVPPPSPSRNASAIARDTVEAPPSVAPPAHIPETSSSAAASSNMSPSIQEARVGRPDFNWLTDSLRNKVQESQRYSTVARLNGLEGRVVLRITVKENGELIVAITKSSGHDVLDQDAVEQVRRLSPFPLAKALGRAQQVLNLPIIYSLNQ